MIRHLSKALVVVVVAALPLGCGSNGDRPRLAEVKGVVTLDDAPLANAAVLFTQTGLRSSQGFTNSNGEYELTYLRDIKGAAIGEHRVRIEIIPGENNPIKSLPKEYNSATTLTANVKRGSNEFNWDLKSQL